MGVNLCYTVIHFTSALIFGWLSRLAADARGRISLFLLHIIPFSKQPCTSRNGKNSMLQLLAATSLFPCPSTDAQSCLQTRHQIHIHPSAQSIQPRSRPTDSGLQCRSCSRKESVYYSLAHRRIGNEKGNDSHVRYRNGAAISMHRRADGSRSSGLAQDQAAQRIFCCSGGKWLETLKQCHAALAGPFRQQSG